MDQDRLLERAQRGDEEALGELFRREWRPIFGLAYAALQNRNDAQDATQEAFLRALQHLDQFQQRGIPFHAYLATIVRNLIRDRWRQPIPATIALHDAEPHGPNMAEVALLADEERIFLRRVLARLPHDYQTVIRLRILEERPMDEVADLMRRSPGAVRVLQHRAILALRAQLDKEPQP